MMYQKLNKSLEYQNKRIDEAYECTEKMSSILFIHSNKTSKKTKNHSSLYRRFNCNVRLKSLLDSNIITIE